MSLTIIRPCLMNLNKSFPKALVLTCASVSLQLILLLKIIKMMKSNFVQKVLIPIVRYGIAVVLGYLTGNGNFTGMF